MSRELFLRNLINKYTQTNSGTRKKVYYDSINNNVILVIPHDKDVDEFDIYNGITDEPYDYLISQLNNKQKLVVCWSAVSGTTSDYTIYYNIDVSKLNLKDINDILKYLTSINDHGFSNYKYTSVNNGIQTKIDFSEMEK